MNSALTLASPGAYPPRPVTSVRLTLVVFLLGMAGCGGAQSSSPTRTLDAFQRAAAAGDFATIYDLLPESRRRDESLVAFTERLATEREELQQTAASIAQARSEGRPPTVEIPASAGVALVVEETEGWRVPQTGFGPVMPRSPAEAAQALRGALARRSLPAILRVLSARARGEVQAEIDAMIEALDSASARGSGSPGRAIAAETQEVPLPDGRTLRIIREGEFWRIDDVR